MPVIHSHLVDRLGGIFTAAGESLARAHGQTLARWVILDAVEDQPSTVAQIARRRGIARQAVQRVADLLERDGPVAYTPNPDHLRAKLLRPTRKGQEILHRISIDQKAWSDAHGKAIGRPELERARALVASIREATSMPSDAKPRRTPPERV